MKCKHCGGRMRKQLLCENCEVVVLRECGPAMSDLEKARTRLQRAEELLRETSELMYMIKVCANPNIYAVPISPGRIDYWNQRLQDWQERRDAFLGESHDD